MVEIMHYPKCTSYFGIIQKKKLFLGELHTETPEYVDKNIVIIHYSGNSALSG